VVSPVTVAYKAVNLFAFTDTGDAEQTASCLLGLFLRMSRPPPLPQTHTHTHTHTNTQTHTHMHTRARAHTHTLIKYKQFNASYAFFGTFSLHFFHPCTVGKYLWMVSCTLITGGREDLSETCVCIYMYVACVCMYVCTSACTHAVQLPIRTCGCHTWAYTDIHI
jgi:hypothetical protein